MQATRDRGPPTVAGLGFSSRSIEHRCKTGRLHVVTRGVYAVGWPALDQRRRWMAAVLACGEDAALSHHSAAALLGIGSELPGRIDVSVPRRGELRRSGLLIRCRPSLAAGDLGFSDGIPVTSPTRTLIDLTTELDLVAVERAVNDADKRDLIDPESLRAALDGYTGEPGVRPLRKLLDKLTFRLSDSDLEIYFRPIARSAGLPPPLSKQWVNGFEVDFFWTDLGLVAETGEPSHVNFQIWGGRRAGDVRLRAAVGKQFKDAGSPNSSAIRATEDAEMRRPQMSSGVRIQPPPTPRRRRRPCIRRRPRAWRRRPRRSRRWI